MGQLDGTYKSIADIWSSSHSMLQQYHPNLSDIKCTLISFVASRRRLSLAILETTFFTVSDLTRFEVRISIVSNSRFFLTLTWSTIIIEIKYCWALEVGLPRVQRIGPVCKYNKNYSLSYYYLLSFKYGEEYEYL